jgi:hypothetical protein
MFVITFWKVENREPKEHLLVSIYLLLVWIWAVELMEKLAGYSGRRGLTLSYCSLCHYNFDRCCKLWAGAAVSCRKQRVGYLDMGGVSRPRRALHSASSERRRRIACGSQDQIKDLQLENRENSGATQIMWFLTTLQHCKLIHTIVN